MGPEAGMEWIAQVFDIIPGYGAGDVIRSLWADVRSDLLQGGYRIASSSGAATELDYYEEWP